MVMMSVDQSLSCSGVMVWNDDKVVQATTIKTPAKMEVILRIADVIDSLEDLIAEYKVSHVVIESLPYGLNSTSVRPLAGLYYFIQNMCLELDLIFEEANVTAVKKFATGSGKAKKPEMIAAFEDEQPLLFADVVKAGAKKTTGLADLADSYFIGAYYRSKL